MTEGPPKGTPPSGSGRFTLATQHPVVMALARQMVIQVQEGSLGGSGVEVNRTLGRRAFGTRSGWLSEQI